MKLVAPVTFGSFSHEGKSFSPDKEGFVDVPDHLVELAKSHGLTLPAHLAPAITPEVEEDLRSQLNAALADNKALLDTASIQEKHIGELEAQLALVQQAAHAAQDDSNVLKGSVAAQELRIAELEQQLAASQQADDDDTSVVVEDVNAMTVRELRAYLTGKGVAIPAGANKDALRVLAQPAQQA